MPLSWANVFIVLRSSRKTARVTHSNEEADADLTSTTTTTATVADASGVATSVNKRCNCQPWTPLPSPKCELQTQSSTISEEAEQDQVEQDCKQKVTATATVNLEDDTCINLKTVSFDTVQIRRFNQILGDQPGCDFPLSLGWLYTDEVPRDLETYDREHHEGNPYYVHAKHMETTLFAEREERLHAVGYPSAFVRRAERRRKLFLLQEIWNHRANIGGEWLSAENLPSKAKIFIDRYICEKRLPQWN